jgi:hypothetical protein
MAALLVAACSSAPKPPPPAPTEAQIRERWSASVTDRVSESVKDPATRQALLRYFGARERAARASGMQFTVESIALGENMAIGGGLSMQRVFALYQEYNNERFVSYLAGLEILGGRIQTEYHRPVGGSGKAFVKLEFAELNRVILQSYRFDDKDPPCCPSHEGRTGYQLNPSNLDELE